MLVNLQKICPQCNDLIIFKTSSAYYASMKNNSTCRTCAEKNLSERGKNNIGEKNPFFGKKHTNETRDKLKNAWEKPSENKQKYIEYMKTDEYLIPQQKKLIGGRIGLGSLKDIWIKKLGEEEGIKRWNEWREIQKTNSTGEKNPMYGKPSPEGSGNGWSGWYKGWFFRSLGELSYMVNVIDRFNLQWVTGESSEFVVKYIDWEGKERNYFPDFIIGDKYMVECKPKKLWDTPSVISKTEGAKVFCKERGMVYKLVDCRKLVSNEILELYKTEVIKFTERYEQKFLERYNKIYFEY